MAELIEGITADGVRRAAAQVRATIAEAAARSGRNADDVTVVAATKYVPLAAMQALIDAGITVVGENRAQDLEAKVAAYGDQFAWEFIGHLQSRKVKTVAGLVRRLHAVSSESVATQLQRHPVDRVEPLEVLVEVNIANDPNKSGVLEAELPAFIACLRAIESITVTGLMTMPPRADSAQDSRRWFAALRELADAHDLATLSMGTTQDYAVAVEEGATLVRVGSTLFRTP